MLVEMKQQAGEENFSRVQCIYLKNRSMSLASFLQASFTLREIAREC
jgi:hypothetical protein